jgi:hypothetical protein
MIYHLQTFFFSLESGRNFFFTLVYADIDLGDLFSVPFYIIVYLSYKAVGIQLRKNDRQD